MSQPIASPASQPAPHDNETLRASTIAMLQSQAAALNAVFQRLAKEIEASPTVDAAANQLRLALKIQSQCRTTLHMLLKMIDPAFSRAIKKEQGTAPIPTPAKAFPGHHASPR